ncbi:MAG: DUF4097 family beta strand repeat protein [Cytophagales bacterium]|nr:DUF4097 family beta strand repeat protein [Armatimonadota bacterium]
MPEPTESGAASREENLLILKMLQDGTISADQAAELLQAVNTRPSSAPAPPTPPAPSVPLPPVSDASFPTPALSASEADGEVFSRARAKIAAARERVAGVQEQLAAAEEKIEQAKDSPNPWEQVAEALKDVPGARSVTEALRGIDPGRIAANARRQARRVARSMRSSIEDISSDFNDTISEQLQGEPQLTAPRETTAVIPAGGMLRVRNTIGDIEVIGSDVPEARAAGVLKIWATDRAAAEALANDIKLVVEDGGEGPTIRVEHPPKVRRVSLDLKVFVPQSGVRVSLLSPSGDVTVRNLKNSGVVLATQSGDARASEIMGDVAAETASGDIAIEGIVGNIAASSASGDIKALRVSGQNFRAITQSGDVSLSESTVPVVAVETVSGDASLKAVTGRTLKMRAVSGDAHAEDVAFDLDTHLDTVSGYISLALRGPLKAGSVHLQTVSGDAELKLPRETSASLEVTTKGGDVKGRVLAPDNKTEKELSGSGMVSLSEAIGVGEGAKITLSSVSGDLEITQESPVIELG